MNLHLTEGLKSGIAGLFRGTANVLATTGLTEPARNIHGIANTIDGTVAGIDKSLTDGWREAVLKTVAIEAGVSRTSILIRPETSAYLIEEAHENLMGKAREKMKDGLSRHDAQSAVIDSVIRRNTIKPALNA